MTSYEIHTLVNVQTMSWILIYNQLKCGFRKKSFIMNAPLVSWAYYFVITFGWVQQQTHPKVMTDLLNWLEVHL